jgi:hypothetical protein
MVERVEKDGAQAADGSDRYQVPDITARAFDNLTSICILSPDMSFAAHTAQVTTMAMCCRAMSISVECGLRASRSGS